ncbi:polymeric immunoglobulin receptor-like protein [Labeo rohita]|nr:polymeric immunoglobulin receptor-like protein [Labeo rohita]
MKILLIFFTFYLISGAVKDIDVTGYSGGSVLVDSGKLWFSDSAKYMAKLPEWRTIINDTKQHRWINEGRFTLFRNNVGNLMIYIRDLNHNVTGEYQIRHHGQWSIDMTLNVKYDAKYPKSVTEFVYLGKEINRCGVNVSHYTERFTELQLNVKHDTKYPKSLTESAYPGEEINITCQIPEEHEVHFCKEDDNHICQNISSSKVTQMNGSSERNEERVFTVIISNVSVRDAGVYWCGAETRDTYLTFIFLNTKIQLNIIMPPVVRHVRPQLSLHSSDRHHERRAELD